MAKRQRSRTQWAELVRAWRESGLSAKEFAGRRRLNAGTLQFWASALKREASAPVAPLEFIEVTSDLAPRVQRFEVHVSHDRWVVVDADFDADALRRLLSVVEVSR